jgi:hypothetical protein
MMDEKIAKDLALKTQSFRFERVSAKKRTRKLIVSWTATDRRDLAWILLREPPRLLFHSRADVAARCHRSP